MQRNMDLLRLEAYSLPSGAICYFTADDDEMAVPGYTREQIDQHLSMIGRSGFIESGSSRPAHGIGFRGLSWAGHDFVDSVRDPDIWQQTKKGVEKVKGFSVDLVVAVAKGFVKKQLEKATGIEIDL